MTSLTKQHLTKSLFFATKVWTRSKTEGISQMGHSLERFRTRTIDLIQVHNLADVDRQMTSLRQWKAKGGFVIPELPILKTAATVKWKGSCGCQKPDFVQINYSLMDRAAASRILPLAQELGMGVIINRPFGGGGIFQVISAKPLPAWAAEFDCHSWAQFLLKWIVSHPAVTCVIRPQMSATSRG